MKKPILMFLLAPFLISCKLYAQENFKWAEMNSFHATAMSCFHSAEVDKLQAAKDSSASILLKAKAWQSSAIPEGIDAAIIKPLLQTLVKYCQAINDAVTANKSDAYLKPLVLKAHNAFHDIVRKAK